MKTLLWMLLVIPLSGWAQTDSTAPFLRKSLWRITLIQPGLAYELRLGRYTTLTSSANVSGGYASESGNNIPTRHNYYLTTQADVGFRYYYNLTRRVLKGKNIRYNSGNYLTFNTRYTTLPVARWGSELAFTTVSHEDKLAFQLLWGHQATLPSRIYADLSGGIQKTTAGNKLEPVILIRIGYTLAR